MASGPTAHTQPLGPKPSRLQASDEKHLLEQYDKIIRFHDDVFAGRHPTIRAKAIAEASPASPIASANAVDSTSQAEIHSPRSRKALPSANAASWNALGVERPTLGQPPSSGTASSGKIKFNPILLEKSEELVRAEIQLQRQRLERALKDEVDQRRAQKHMQAEALADFDLSDVLAKALTRVQSTSASVPAHDNLTANNEAASDSFDDNTFYSSQHDTPESHQLSRIHHESEERQAAASSQQRLAAAEEADMLHSNRPAALSGNQDASSYQPAQSFYTTTTPTTTTTTNAAAALGHGLVPGLNNYIERGHSLKGPSQNTSAGQSISDDYGNMHVGQRGSNVDRDQTYLEDDIYADSRPPSPLARAHESSLALAQQTQPSSSGPSGQSSLNGKGLSNISQGAPAQVAALRNEPTTAATSPDSSPQGGRGSDKKKSKKKKRKATRQGPEADEVYIKPEPRSPSPMEAPSYIRPTKRPRQAQRTRDESGYEVPRYEPSPNHGAHEQYGTATYQNVPTPYLYTNGGVYPHRSASMVAVGRQPLSGQHHDAQFGDGTYTQPHVSHPHSSISVASSGRSASQAYVNEPSLHTPRHYYHPYETTRLSMRPDADYGIGAPRPQPARILVDPTGREYIEPPSHHPFRYSVAPTDQPPEPELHYDPRQTRALSRAPVSGHYPDRPAAVYARVSPRTMPRRVVTQPGFAVEDFGDGRQREYSMRPVTQAGSYAHSAVPSEGRQLDPESQAYAARAASLRPVDSMRYDIPHTEYGRIQSVRPEPTGRTYVGAAQSVQPEARRVMTRPYVGEYGSRPIEQHLMPGEYGARPHVDRIYESQARPGEEIAFVERPRGPTNEIVYADNVRRELYRGV